MTSPLLIFFAPNVNVGGGYVLLRTLLDNWPCDLPVTLFLDSRAKEKLPVPSGARIEWVDPRAMSRLRAQRVLQQVAGVGSTIFCFNNLPPLFAVSGRVVVFLQNRLTITAHLAPGNSFRTRLRQIGERWAAKAFRHRVTRYIVQTPSMASELMQWHERAGGGASVPVIDVIPFSAPIPVPADLALPTDWDFIYVADGLAHKNHTVLLQAWSLLGSVGLHPSLVLTLRNEDAALISEIARLREAESLKIYNIGHVTHQKVIELYAVSRALVYPSLFESFGLPLIEAGQVGLPIIAGELDYVRDVCCPIESFDPRSPVSLARAIQRFLGQPQACVTPISAAAFLARLQTWL